MIIVMEKLFYELENEDFVVHLERDDNWKNGYVYPINRYIGTDDWSYQSDLDGSYEEDPDKSRCLFGFMFCWRGVWEARIHFKDDEYWGEELEVLTNIWKVIEKDLMQRIIKETPHDHYDIE